MRIFKTVLAILLAVALFMTSTSCSQLFADKVTDDPFYSETPSGETPHERLPALPDADPVWTVKENCARLTEMLSFEKEVDTDAFMALYEETETQLYTISDYASIAYLHFSVDTSDTEKQDRYNAYSDLYSEYVSELIKLYKPIYESAMKDVFYQNWSEEEIEKAVASSDKMTDRYVELSKTSSRLASDFDALDQDSPTFLDDSSKLYAQIVKTNNELAREYGYENYVEYAYSEVYGRDYTPESALESGKYISEYIVPLADILLKRMQTFLGINQVSGDITTLCYTDVSVSYMEKKLKDYYTALGDEYLEALNGFAENSVITDGEQAMEGAYTVHLNTFGGPRCYFGPGYQTLSTYIHEQGHYNAFLLSGCNISSLDLCETQSQGNEWLYLAYSEKDYTNTRFKYLSYYYFYNQIFTIVLSASCDAFEQYVYTHPELTAEEYDDVFLQQLNAFGAYDLLDGSMAMMPEDYWHYAIVSNSMYYYSYAVSLIPSIELFVVAREEGFDAAKEIYTAIGKVEEDAMFVKTVTEAGLSDPTSKEAYKRIYDYFIK